MSRTSDKLRSEILRGRKLGPRADDACWRGHKAFREGKRRKAPYKGPLAKYWLLGWDNASNDRYRTEGV